MNDSQALRRLVMQHPKRSETAAASEDLDGEIAAIAADNRAAEYTTQVSCDQRLFDRVGFSFTKGQ